MRPPARGKAGLPLCPATRRSVVALFGIVLANCAPAASAVPLANAEPEGPDVYFYGDASNGGKDLPEDAPGTRPEPKPAKPAATQPKAPTAEQPARADASGPEADDAANVPQTGFAALPGRYAGTDTLKINIDGAPERVETDDAAKLTVEKPDDAKPDAYVFKIVDSQSGADLCSVTGVAKQRKIEFEPGQTCLETILGVSMTATLVSGTARLDGKQLVVDYTIELEVDSPRGPVEGRIDYHFAGTRE